jgi:hypothetical protein
VVASNYSWNHCISEKYKRIHLFKIYFLQSSPFVKLYTVGNIPGDILWKPFQLFHRILNYVSNITKVPSLQCLFQSREEVEISWSQARRVWRTLQCCNIVLCYEVRDQNRPACWTLSWRRNRLLVLRFSECLLLIAPLMRRMISIYISLFTVVIPVDYNSEFPQII